MILCCFVDVFLIKYSKRNGIIPTNTIIASMLINTDVHDGNRWPWESLYFDSTSNSKFSPPQWNICFSSVNKVCANFHGTQMMNSNDFDDSLTAHLAAGGRLWFWEKCLYNFGWIATIFVQTFIFLGMNWNLFGYICSKTIQKHCSHSCTVLLYIVVQKICVFTVMMKMLTFEIAHPEHAGRIFTLL